MGSRVRPWLRELAIIGAVAVAALLVMREFDGERQRAASGKLPVGQIAPAFELAEVQSGASISLEALRGKPVILAFWATHCGPCRTELPALERVHRAAGGRYAVVGVSSEPAGTVRAFLAPRALSFPTLSDARGAVSDAYGVRTIPMTVIIDASGAIVHDFVGPATEAVLNAHLARLLGG